jgi:glycosyltransferase involved in cell wall biosynthesis
MKVTVVTPSFGQLDWLELCVASVRDQTAHMAKEGPNKSARPLVAGSGSFATLAVEHIVCDGGSAGIEEFKRRMMERFPQTPTYRLEFLVGADAGMYDAINKGLLRATGDVCSYLNCDEQYLPGALAKVGARLAAEPATEVLFGDTIVVDGAGAALCYWRPYVPTLDHLGVATLNTLSCSTFFRRSLVEQGHLFDPAWKVAGDMMWIRGLLQAGRCMRCLNEPLAVFTWLGKNLGLSPTAREEFAKTRVPVSVVRSWVLRLRHGWRKLLSGAYVYRDADYAIFSLSEREERQHFHKAWLGWKWPRG